MPALIAVLALALATAATPPAQVLRVFPADGATVRGATPIGAELDFTRGNPGDPASLQLLVDGVDVTRDARITQTRDWPPSFVSVAVAPRALPPGTHRRS
jgi:hypothetical protein